MERVTLGAHREVRLPAKVARRLRLRKGAELDLHVTHDGVYLVRAGRLPKDQRYFWTPEWQAKEREADADIAAGRVHGPFATAGAAIADLRSKRR